MMNFTKIQIMHTTVIPMMFYNDEISPVSYCHNVLHIDALRQGFTWSDTDCVKTRAAPLCQRHATTTTSTPTTATTTQIITTTAETVYECTSNLHLQIKYLYSLSLFNYVSNHSKCSILLNSLLTRLLGKTNLTQ